jgi:hypothetical protein
MSGFSKPPTADGAPWIGPEQTQQNTQSEKKAQSLGERLRHKGRHYFKKGSRIIYRQNEEPTLARWLSKSHKVKDDVNHRASPPAVHNPPVGRRAMDAKNELQGPQQLPRPISSPPSADLKGKKLKHMLTSYPQHQAQLLQQPWPASTPHPVAAANSVPFFNAEGHIVKPPSYRDWLKGHTTSRKRVNSAPVLPLGSLDLTGVGSQYDATNRPTSALPTGTDQSIGYPQEQRQYSETTLVGIIHQLIGLIILTSHCVNRINPRSQLGRHKSMSRSLSQKPIFPK